MTRIARVVAPGGGHTYPVQTLLAKGAEVNAKGFMGLTALTWAAFNGHTDTVKVLLAARADVNQTAVILAKE